MTALGTGLDVVPFEVSSANRFSKPIILRGTLEFCCINLNGAAIPAGGVIDITIETEEDDGI